MIDDERGTLLPVAVEGTGSSQGVRGGGGGRIIGGEQDDTAWASYRREIDLEKLGHGGRAADVLHGLTDQGGPAEMPGGGITMTSGDEDGNAGKFYAPACPGHRDNFGVRKTPPTMLPLMRNSGPLAYTEHKEPLQRTELQGSGSKEAVVSG